MVTLIIILVVLFLLSAKHIHNKNKSATLVRFNDDFDPSHLTDEYIEAMNEAFK